MHHGDYTSAPYSQFPYLQNPPPNSNPNPSDLPPNSYASAPPYTSSYTPSDYNPYPSNYPPYAQNFDHVSVPGPTPAPPTLLPPTAPSYSPTPNPTYQSPFDSTSQSPSVPPFESHSAYATFAQQQTYHPTFDQHQTVAANYGSTPTPSLNTNPSPNPPYSSFYSGPYGQQPNSVPPSYDSPYENPAKFGQSGSYVDDYGGYNRGRPDLGSDINGKRSDSGIARNDSCRDELYGDGVFAYEGGKTEPYGARGTTPKSSTWAGFDDYGRAISFPTNVESSKSSTKIVKAVPKVDIQEDVKSGVLKFRVKLLAESGGQSTMDVLCQIGLDGIRMLDPSTSRTLRIYPLENITRCDKIDSSTLAFWSKSSVDIEPRRIRLQSNSYTTNTLLDTVTAAIVQFKEMGGSRRLPGTSKTSEQPAEKKKGIADWMNIIKPANEEKDHWVPDEAVSKCTACGTDFGAFVRRHHCRNCGDVFCDKCTHGRIALTADENAPPVRVCDRCMAEVTQRLSNAKEAANKPSALQSHEDLARKLQEEMERNRKSTGSKYDGSGMKMKEVACPTCTVHLQVQVPTSGSETIECGVCQHPFLVSAH